MLVDHRESLYNHGEKWDPPEHKFTFKTDKKNGSPLTAEGARKTSLGNTLKFQMAQFR